MRSSIQLLFIAIFILACCTGTRAQTDGVVQRIFLVGDAGEMQKDKHPVCDWLKQQVDWNDKKNVLIYLGDNIYPEGMPPVGAKSYEAAKRVMDYQVSVVQGKNARAFFVPGNHDWKEGRTGGWKQVKNESDYIESLQLPNVQLLPKNGCPGPEEVVIGDKLVLVCMDSQWWLQQNERPGLESDCDCKDEEAIITRLKDIIASHPDKLVVLAMHHPFYTHGKHGGYFTLKQHIFPLTELNPNLYIPLPVIGSIYPIARGVFGNIQDTRHPRYKDLIQRVEEVIKGHQNVVHVAGHEHTLQLLQHDSTTYIVSGAGSKNTQVKTGKNTLFAKEEKGFAEIEITESGKVTVKFYTVTSSSLQQPVYTLALPELPAAATAAVAMVKIFPDSVTITPAAYFKAGGFKQFLLGSNYRKEWSEHIRVKVFDMGTESGGLTPLRRGGGHQSKSLRLSDASGKQYVLRSIEKFVTDAALPPDLRGTFAKDLVSDGVSASYPYAALSVPPLAEAAGVPHATPKLVYVPDDPRLGKYRADFGNMFCLFEEREPGTSKKTYSTDEMEKKLQEDNDNTIDQKAVLQARLLDMFVMDFDRHEDQWRWAGTDNGKGKTFYPVPRDRDQPFFINIGVLPYMASRPWIAPQLQGFRAKAKNINVYNFNAKNFDHNYMTALTAADWKNASEAFVKTMTGELIEKALQLQPKEIQGYAMNRIISILKERRKYFVNEMMGYYQFLSKTVTVAGSDKKELFDVQRNEDGSVTVIISKLNKEGEAGKPLYERKFISGETKEIRLYGMGGDDKFYVHGNDAGSIKVRIIGGAGEDVFDNVSGAAAGKTRIYDLSTEKNQFTGNGNYLSFLSANPKINDLDRRGFKYNVLAPFIAVAYNPDDGIYLGASFKYTVQGFHKQPFKLQHTLSVSHSLATKAYNFKYGLEAIDAIGKTDLLFHANVKAPNNTINYFKYGNESVFDKSGGKNIRYYRARFDLADVSLLLRANITNKFSFAAGPVFQYFILDSSDNKGRFINQTGINGLDAGTLNKAKTYAGGQAQLHFDNRNNKALPGRGINWETSFSTYRGLTANSNNYSQLNSDLSLFISFSKQANFVIATRIGAGFTFGKYEFYQAQYLSGTENLRGYRKYRFAGDKMLYHNLDLRIKIADFHTYLFPGAIGLLAFHDVGRVWLKGENSSKWHQGFGGGLWFAPLKRFVITGSYGYGDDGGLPVISFGWMY
jgi:Omp85 superfamily domain/Calcineurin-like phosphoesterase